MRKLKATVVVASVALLSCVCSRGKSGGSGGDDAAKDVTALAAGFTLAADAANADLAELTKAPHPHGSPRQAEVTTWLEGRIKALGLTAVREPFTATVPNPAALGASGPVAETLTKDGVNLWALGAVKADAPCVVLLASHYDTKVVSGTDYLGANDGASSSVAVLHLLQYLKANAASAGLTCDVAGVWFDGEEATLAGWSDGTTVHPAKLEDHTYGSRHAVERMTACRYEGKTARCLPADLGGKPVAALVLMDMIGSPGVVITRDAYSTAGLVKLAEAAAGALGTPEAYAKSSHAIEDDHVPFLKSGVPALDLIDFNHLDYWHKAGDDPATLAPDSIQKAARIALYVAASVAKDPASTLGG